MTGKQKAQIEYGRNHGLGCLHDKAYIFTYFLWCLYPVISLRFFSISKSQQLCLGWFLGFFGGGLVGCFLAVCCVSDPLKTDSLILKIFKVSGLSLWSDTTGFLFPALLPTCYVALGKCFIAIWSHCSFQFSSHFFVIFHCKSVKCGTVIVSLYDSIWHISRTQCVYTPQSWI